MTIELDLRKLWILVVFLIGFVLAMILCCPRTVNENCITYDGVVYCNSNWLEGGNNDN